MRTMLQLGALTIALSLCGSSFALAKQPRVQKEPSLTYDERGEFDVPDLGAGSLLVNRDGGKLVVRYDFVHGAEPVLKGKTVSIVIGPRDGWTQNSPQLERVSAPTKGDAAYVVFSEKEIEKTFGDKPLATYAKVVEKGAVRYINLNNKLGQKFSLEPEGAR